MEALHSHDVNAENTNLPENTRTFAISFAGYDREKGRDDIIYMAINTYWEPVTITLPNLNHRGVWHLSVDTYGDEAGQYVYPRGKEPRIDGSYVMRPRTVVIFTGRIY